MRIQPCLFVLLFLTWGCAGEPKETVLTDEQRREAQNALRGLEVYEGLDVQLFASEPMLRNPTNIDVDSRGRVWVTEGFNYRPHLNPDKEYDPRGDRIVILEETDSDGQAEDSKVYYQGPEIDAALGILVLGNKVIVSCSPNVLIFTDFDSDDRPDKIDTLFTGIGGVQHDHAAHAFVFGPDGRLYSNLGDQGGQMLTKKAEPIIDLAGNAVNNSGNPYRKGMLFRCNLDGTEMEVLGHNFRNPYEVTIDSYGSLWQSDNDDDGNRSVRINFILEYGNYGYTDELTGAGWRTRRTGSNDSIPFKHWHLNDPGVVPNMLQTGDGSPCGITVYEGRLLPEIFWDQIIHADPGPNVVRSYPATKDGAGYKADIVNILKGVDDAWFRPVDVCVAPDGSLIIADWYDPGVGGHQVGDKEKGRIYRVAPSGSGYNISPPDFSSAAGAALALQSPNMATRYLGWSKLKSLGSDAETELRDLYNSSNLRFRARALWLLAQLRNGASYLEAAYTDNSEDIRIAALRIARAYDAPELMNMLTRAAYDPSIQVKREAAIALRNQTDASVPNLLAGLAASYSYQDRWYLEALGIGSDLKSDEFFDAWLPTPSDDLNSGINKDIIWRTRSEKAAHILGDLISNPETSAIVRMKYFRALDFHSGGAKDQALISILNGELGSETEIQALVLKHISPGKVKSSPQVAAALNKVLESSKGSSGYIDLVKRFKLKSESKELKELMFSDPNGEVGMEATWLLYELEGIDYFKDLLQSQDPSIVNSTLSVMANLNGEKNWNLLKDVAYDSDRQLSMRRMAITSMARGREEEKWLLDALSGENIPPELENAAVAALMAAYRHEVRQKVTDMVGDKDREETFMPELLAKKGDPESGLIVFKRTCAMCHVVNGSGTDFGPELSSIGNKLAKEALYTSILNPDAGINFGFEGYLVKMQNGRRLMGYIISQTDDQLVLKVAGRGTLEIERSEIHEVIPLPNSLMPSGLERTMTEQEFVDLVEYLATLKDETI